MLEYLLTGLVSLTVAGLSATFKHRIDVNTRLITSQASKIEQLEKALSGEKEGHVAAHGRSLDIQWSRLETLEREMAEEKASTRHLLERVSTSLEAVAKQGERFVDLERSINQNQHEFSVSLTALSTSLNHVVDELRAARESGERVRRDTEDKLGNHAERLARLEMRQSLGTLAPLAPQFGHYASGDHHDAAS